MTAMTPQAAAFAGEERSARTKFPPCADRKEILTI
jgi:hypothetical protein